MIKVDKNLLKLYREKFGEDNQIICLIEEMAELTHELTRHLRKSDKVNLGRVMAETADVLIMMEQMMIILGIKNDTIQRVVDCKCARLKEAHEAGIHVGVSAWLSAHQEEKK